MIKSSSFVLAFCLLLVAPLGQATLCSLPLFKNSRWSSRTKSVEIIPLAIQIESHLKSRLSKMEWDEIAVLLGRGEFQEIEFYLKSHSLRSLANESAAIIENFLHNAPVVSIKRHLSEGKSDAYWVTFPGNVQALFKPIQDRGNPAAEIATRKLDELLQFDLVPITVERSLKTRWFSSSRSGSLQLIVPSAKPAHSPEAETLIDSPWDRRMTFLDAITGNSDRNGNFLVTDRLIAIDNGEGFSFLSNLNLTKIPASMRKHYVLSLEDQQRLNALSEQDFWDALSPGLPPEKIATTYKRFRALLNFAALIR
jgi:hypothetical protein